MRDALAYFDHERYVIFAWCVMPNHVHAVVQPNIDDELPHILHSWKSYTAQRIHALVGQQGHLWQPESYDHLIRNDEEFAHAVRYVLENPHHTGLDNWPWFGLGFETRSSR